MLIKPSIASLLAFLLMAPLTQADLAKGLDAVTAGHWSAALAEFKPLANKGDPNAQVNLGNLYMRGLGVEQNYGTAYAWYEKAAHQGHSTAQNKLAVMLYYGLGMKENHAEAAQWFLKAAETGDAAAAMVMAELYDKGDGVPASKVNAYVWSSIAADLGKQEALDQRVHLTNELSPTDLNTALTHLNVWREEHGMDRSDPTRTQAEPASSRKKIRPARSPKQKSEKKPEP